MIINTIKIENISSFKGEHVFHFNHTPTKTITLIFGENGAGNVNLPKLVPPEGRDFLG